jgi:hypothetical protein
MQPGCKTRFDAHIASYGFARAEPFSVVSVGTREPRRALHGGNTTPFPDFKFQKLRSDRVRGRLIFARRRDSFL